MSRRREVFAAAGPQPVSAPPPVEAINDPKTPAGHCPKCGAHVGYAVRAHAKDCVPPKHI